MARLPASRALVALWAVLALCPGAGAGAAPASDVEARFLAVPSAAGALETARVAGARAHFAGTPGDYAFATYMRDRLTAAGFSAALESFRGPIDRPVQLGLALIDPTGRQLRAFDLREGPVAGDPDGSLARGGGLPFNYGSGSGIVRAPLVVAGRGLESDYAALARAHAGVIGRIAIVRYGAEFRGSLAERAQRHGAAGVIFYSDPRDDRTRPETSVQRGMVSSSVLRIPTLPVTLRTARALLDAAARGIRAKLVVRIARTTGTMWNTVGILRGRTEATVLLGGHRDAWVYGVTDNGSGIAALLEVARAFGALAKSGWQPERSIVVAGWDAEEIGDLGSEAYVQAHRTDLAAHALAYLNADEVVAGTKFEDDAAAAVAGLVTRAARDLGIANVPAMPAVPGGGSDHVSFAYAPGPGVASINVGFGGSLPTYHSAYDDLATARAIDPSFALHRDAARVLGLIALRLSETPQPYRFRGYVDQLRDAQATLLVDPAVMRIGTDPNVFGPLDAAIAHFSAAATEFDDAPRKRPLSATIAATHLVDRALYGSSGYRDSTFPAIRTALRSGNAAGVGTATASATRAIDAAADLLAPSSS